MDTRTNGSRTNGSGLGLGQGNNCPGPICPRIIATICAIEQYVYRTNY